MQINFFVDKNQLKHGSSGVFVFFPELYGPAPLQNYSPI